MSDEARAWLLLRHIEPARLAPPAGDDEQAACELDGTSATVGVGGEEKVADGTGLPMLLGGRSARTFLLQRPPFDRFVGLRCGSGAGVGIKRGA